MSDPHRVLLIADPARQRGAAFERAFQIAQRAKAHVHVAILRRSRAIDFASWIFRDGAATAREAYLEADRGWVNGEAAILRGRGVDCTASATWSARPECDIVRLAREQGTDLVVKDARDLQRAGRLHMTPLDAYLIRHCPVPLMLVKTDSVAVPRRVIAAVDVHSRNENAEALNTRVIATARAHALSNSAELHLACVFQPRLLAASLAEPMRTVFRARARAHGVPEGRRHFLTGSPDVELARLSRGLHSDLLVIGSPRRTGKVEEVLSSHTAEWVQLSTAADVLAMKPAGYPGAATAS
ncbi:MAG: universal stress protein [Panacagrimonas sp.]